MSKGPKGFDHPTPIEPVSRGNFVWWLLEIPIVLFVAGLAGVGVSWLTTMTEIYGTDEISRILMSGLEKQPSLMIATPLIITTLYFIVRSLRGSS